MGENENQIVTVRTPPVEELANVSHQRGDVQMITTTKDKIESILSASNPLSSNFFALMVGAALSIFLTLKSGAIEEEWRRIFWLAFVFSLVLVVFFGIGMVSSELKKRRLRKELLNPPSAALRGRGEGTA